MLVGKTPPLAIARKVLKPETIREFLADEFPPSASLILDRWALNSPEILRAFEAKNSFHLILRLDQQTTWESRALNSDTAWEMSQRGMSDWEILSELGVDTELRTIE